MTRHKITFCALTGLPMLACALPTLADTTELISARDRSLRPYSAMLPSYGTTVSADGRFIAFSSSSPDFVPDDTNGRADIFARNRQTRAIEKITQASDGGGANANSTLPALSANGRFVAFVSEASNLVNGDTNAANDVFVYDRVAGTTARVSVSSSGEQSQGESFLLTFDEPAINANGRIVAFSSRATNLVPGASTSTVRVYVHDRQTGATTLQSVTPKGNGGAGPKLSADGRYLVFATSDGNVYLRDLQAQTTTRLSTGLSGAQPNADSNYPNISASGRYIVFSSNASNLVPNDDNNLADVFLYDRETGAVSRVTDTQGINDGPVTPTVSADGRFVAYQDSYFPQIYLKDRVTGVTTVVASGQPVFWWPEGSVDPTISADGKFIAYTSDSPTLVENDGNDFSDAFVYDRDTATSFLASAAKIPSSTAPNYSYNNAGSVSGDGRKVAFTSWAALLAPNDTNGWEDSFVRNRPTKQTFRASVSSTGEQANQSQAGTIISANGRFAAFVSNSYNLVPNDTNQCVDVFVRDLQTGVTERVSVAADGSQTVGTDFPPDCDSSNPSISADGRYVVFVSNAANLPAPPTGPYEKRVFVRDRQAQATELVGVLSEGSSYGLGFSTSISADGRFVAFDSAASNGVPGDTNGHMDVYVRDRQLGQTYLVSRSPTGAQGNADSYSVSISADGSHVAFNSDASNLVPGDANGETDVFVADRANGTLILGSVDSNGLPGNDRSTRGALSRSGRYLAFNSYATNLVAGDANNEPDIFLRDLRTGTTTLMSVTSTGEQTSDGSFNPSISADGRTIAFTTQSPNVAPSDLNMTSDVFVRQRTN